MAGVTDQPYRNLCRALGAHWVVSEMITSDQRLWGSKKSDRRLEYHNEAEPRWIQIAGADPEMMAAAAIVNVERGAQIIDINMGCPAKKVCRRAAGSALMRDEDLVARILRAVVEAVDVPVTLKTRLGWSRDEMNGGTIASIAESAGISALTIHGRTRACKFEGPVDYEAIGRIRAAVSIPVVANGDITTPLEAADVLRRTGCDAVMVGRAAQGRPWLAAHIDHYLQTGELKKNPDASEIKRLIVAHISQLHRFYGEVGGVRIARKHVGWYLENLDNAPAAAAFRRTFNALENAAAQLDAIDHAFLQEAMVA